MIGQTLIIWGQRKAVVIQVDTKRNMLAFDVSCITKMTVWLSVAKLQALNPGVEFNLQNVSSEVSVDDIMVAAPTLKLGAVLEEIKPFDPDETQEMPKVDTDDDVSLISQLQGVIDDPLDPLPYDVKTLLMQVYSALKAQGDLILQQQKHLNLLAYPEFGV